MVVKKLLINLGGKIPKKLKWYFEKKLIYAGIEENVDIWISKRILLAVLFSLVFGLIVLNLVSGIAPVLVFLGALLIIFFVSYLQLYFAILERTNRMERALPDFLMLMVSNLHAGMTPFDSFLKAARPEFGPLYQEVLNTGASVGGKRSLETAMEELSKRFDSDVFAKTIELFLRATRAGGSVAKLLAANAEQIRGIQDLRSELIGTTRQQSILLGFIVAVLMPFLLGVGYNFVLVFLSINKQLTEFAGGEKLPTVAFFTPGIGLLPEEMYTISVTTLVVTNILVSLFIGIIRYGKPLYGLKYLLQILVVSLIMFVVTQYMLQGLVTVV